MSLNLLQFIRRRAGSALVAREACKFSWRTSVGYVASPDLGFCETRFSPWSRDTSRWIRKRWLSEWTEGKPCLTSKLNRTPEWL